MFLRLGNPFLSTTTTNFGNLIHRSNQWFVYGSESHGRFATIRSDEHHRGYSFTLGAEATTEARYLGTKFYELKDHLGNVRVVLKDWKLNPNNTGLPPFTAQPEEVFNYYAFGMLIPGFFSNSDPDYRFGFNGMLRDDDVRDKNAPISAEEGRGNSYDFGARVLNPRVGSWLSLDPLRAKYPSVSAYVFVLNNPINAVDPDGKVVLFFNGMHTGNGGRREYWKPWDRNALSRIEDNSVRYYDGAMGGKEALETLMDLSYKIGGISSVILNLATKSSLSYDNRFDAGKNLGYGDSKSIIDNLSEGEVITIISHSMGTAFARGFMEGMYNYAKDNNLLDKLKFGDVYDINSFQGGSVKNSENFRANYFAKKGGLDGGPNIGDGLNMFVFSTNNFLSGNSVPSVTIPPGSVDISNSMDIYKGHAIRFMSISNLNKSKNPHEGTPLIIMSGSNNSKPVIEGENYK